MEDDSNLSDELEVLAAVGREVQPAATQLALAIGSSRPWQELTAWLGDVVRYHRLPHLAKLATAAAEKIHTAGLPTRAVPDKLVRAILTDGAFEDDDDMRDRWANLLANARTQSDADVHPSFADTLRQLAPIEARILDLMYQPLAPTLPPPPNGWPDAWTNADFEAFLQLEPGAIGAAHTGNLRRLGLCFQPLHTFDAVFERSDDKHMFVLTPLGAAFVAACRPPRPTDI